MKIAIIHYSTYGHVGQLAKSIKEGVEASGQAEKVDIFQIHETLSEEILTLIHAPEKPDIPEASVQTFQDYDAFLIGFPTRYGNIPSQVSSLYDMTGGLWASSALSGKPVGFFVSTGSLGGGQEATIKNVLSFVAHQGMIYIPLSGSKAAPLLANLDEIHGGSPWGAGTFAGGDGSRKPSKLELDLAKIQGEQFASSAIKFVKTEKSEEKEEKKPEQPTSSSKEAEGTSKEAAARTKQSTAQDSAEKTGCGVKCLIM